MRKISCKDNPSKHAIIDSAIDKNLSLLFMLQTTFYIPNPADYTARREGETKLGEAVQTARAADWQKSISESAARFVWLGLAEDVGVRANGGIGGAGTAPEAGLRALLNIQNDTGISGKDLLLGGLLQCHMPEEASLEQLRAAVEEIDVLVAEKVKIIVAAGKIPLVMGGGHNNCYGLLRGASEALQQPLAAINLDAHSDFRKKEGRHSGNGFRYAYDEGFLKKYVPVCLHRNYNAPDIVAGLTASPDFRPSFYEDVFLGEKSLLEETLTDAFGHVHNFPTGLELDLDCIENVLSSAMTPSGISMCNARRFVCRGARECRVAYLHLTEAVGQRADGQQSATTGKALAYLASDFMRNAGA